MRTHELILLAAHVAGMAACTAPAASDGSGERLVDAAVAPWDSQAGLIQPSRRELAPDFVLFDQTDQPFALAEHRGSWVVVHLYPRSDTPKCACDATAFTEHLWRFSSLDAVVACITSEPPELVRRFAKKYGLGIPVLSDITLDVARMFDAVDLARADPVIRTTLLIDPEGRVARRWDDVTNRDHVEEILEVLGRCVPLIASPEGSRGDAPIRDRRAHVARPRTTPS